MQTLELSPAELLSVLLGTEAMHLRRLSFDLISTRVMLSHAIMLCFGVMLSHVMYN